MTAVPTIVSARPNKTRLTDRGIRALRPDPRRTIDYADTEVPGLRVRVTPAAIGIAELYTSPCGSTKGGAGALADCFAFLLGQRSVYMKLEPVGLRHVNAAEVDAVHQAGNHLDVA